MNRGTDEKIQKIVAGGSGGAFAIIDGGVQGRNEYFKGGKVREASLCEYGGHTLSVPRNVLSLYMKNEDKSFIAPCDSSFSNPVSVDFMSYVTTIDLPDFDKNLGVQFTFKMAPYTDYFSKIKERLNVENKTIADLLKEGVFYKYEDASGLYYIADHPTLTGITGEPLIFVLGDQKEGYFSYLTYFLWKPNIYVLLRPQTYPFGSLPKPISMDAWIKTFPIILKEISIIDTQHESNQDSRL